jgi:phosphate transport system protein
MILLGVAALQSRDKDAVSKLYEMDDIVDTIYRNYLRNVFTSNSSEGMSPRCYASALLILRYLERISDHACYVGDSVNYIVTGASRPRR